LLSVLLLSYAAVGHGSVQATESAAGAAGAPLPVTLGRPAAQAAENIDDITGKYHFLSADDTLGILEEEGKLKGYIEIAQGEEESDAVLTYDITSGLRKKDQVDFKTNTIHGRYYHFSGKVERGSGRGPDDPDYLRLVGDLETVTVKGDTGQESVDRKHLVLKSLGKSEGDEQQMQGLASPNSPIGAILHSMKRATVTIPGDLAKAVESYVRAQEAPPALTAVVQAALRQYLSERGYLGAVGPLRITPAERGSGRRDVSQAHDRYLAAQ